MAVGVLEVEAAAAAPVVELAVIGRAGAAAVGDPILLHAAEDRVELALADMKRVVVALELAVVIEQQREALVHPHRREVIHSPALEPEDAREELGGRDLVARRDDGVVQGDRHATSLPLVSLRPHDTLSRW